MGLKFQVVARDGQTQARVGIMEVNGIAVETPVFMPVGTHGSVKAMAPWEIAQMGFRLILCNTYHLYLRPGQDIISEAGGLHKFISWPYLILTDSGGYQVFSLSPLVKVSDTGVRFRSHVDGSEHFLSPEAVIGIQERLGSDIMMVLDQPVAYPSERAEAELAAERTINWARRSVEARCSDKGSLFGIIQGSTYPDLRISSVQEALKLGFDGFAIGGLSVGEPKSEMYSIVELCAPLLPEDKPRYLMGVGSPDDVVEAVARGIDMFDCVIPTRLARHGVALTSDGFLTIRNAEYSRDFLPVDACCECVVCRNFTRSYIRHLLKSGEILGIWALTFHNLYAFAKFMREIRESIKNGTFGDLRRRFQFCLRI